MRRVLIAVGQAAVVVACCLPAEAGAADGHFFHTPSHNIFCGYLPAGNDAVLRCDILSGLRPEPRGACELDWTGFSISRSGNGRAACAGDTVADLNAPVLEYGSSWSTGAFRCLSRSTGLRCTNRGHHGFFLSRARSYAW